LTTKDRENLSKHKEMKKAMNCFAQLSEQEKLRKFALNKCLTDKQ